MHTPIFNVRCFKVGGIWFLKVGRLTFSFCISRAKHEPCTDDCCVVYRAYEPMIGKDGY